MKVGFIGAGNMGSALARAAARSGAEIFVFDTDAEKARLLATDTKGKTETAKNIAEICDYVFLAVKPSIIPSVAKEIGPFINGVAVSMAAGVKISAVEEALGKKAPVIRIMPNTPAAIGEGMTLWCKNDNITDEAAAGFTALLEASGTLDEIPERLIDAASAVSGCGPAFVYMFIEALADGGVRCGLPRDKALLYAASTLKGAAGMVLLGEGHPEELKDKVCSPGGSTIEGVHALEEAGFRAAASNAVIKAYEKTLMLGK